MSALQKSFAIVKRLLGARGNNLPKYATIGEKKMDNANDHLVWIDMEMTGLDIDTCHIIELACLITNSELKIISDDFRVIINQPDHILESMNKWCIEHHMKSGLTEECRNSKISLESAEKALLQFVQNYVPEKKCPVAGNSVYMDRLFLRKYMPLVDDYLHYRIVDISTIKELTRRWNSDVYNSAPRKACAHRAIDDIKESIQELQFYKNNVFKTTNSQS